MSPSLNPYDRNDTRKATDIGNMTHTKKVQKADTPLCKVVGHDWLKTTSDKVQVCSRKECGRIKHLLKGHWTYDHYVPRKKCNVRKQAVEIAELWEALEENT